MSSDLDKFINERFSHCRRSKGIQAVADDSENVVFDEDLHELYRMGERSRDLEVRVLKVTVDAQWKQLEKAAVTRLVIPWWVGVVTMVIATAYFYFNFIYVRP